MGGVVSSFYIVILGEVVGVVVASFVLYLYVRRRVRKEFKGGRL